MDEQMVAGNPESVQREEVVAPRPHDLEAGDKAPTFHDRVWEFERQIIAEALKATGGRVTRAARRLGLTHQGLCYIINNRHKELLSERTPLRIRRKSIITKGKHK